MRTHSLCKYDVRSSECLVIRQPAESKPGSTSIIPSSRGEDELGIIMAGKGLEPCNVIDNAANIIGISIRLKKPDVIDTSTSFIQIHCNELNFQLPCLALWSFSHMTQQLAGGCWGASFRKRSALQLIAEDRLKHNTIKSYCEKKSVFSLTWQFKKKSITRWHRYQKRWRRVTWYQMGNPAVPHTHTRNVQPLCNHMLNRSCLSESKQVFLRNREETHRISVLCSN